MIARERARSGNRSDQQERMKPAHFVRPWAGLFSVAALLIGQADAAPPLASPATSRATSKPGAAAAAAAEKILKDVKPPAGFDMTLFAAPPDVNYPTCLAPTPRGEVFIGIDDQGSLGRDADRGRIVRCVDADDDGVADQIT